MTEPEESSAHWARLADEQEAAAKWDESLGLGDVSVYYHRAALYRRTAEALHREATTGVPHCSACGGPHASPQHLLPGATGCKCQAHGCPWCRGSK